MDDNKEQLPDRVAFMADAHLGMPGDTPMRIEKVSDFFRWLRGKVSHLYIVGDLFDFWFEYSSVVPNTAPHVIFELYNLVQSGTKVTVFAGNHDYWFGPYIKDHVGLKTELYELVVEHQGKRIYLHHGDGLYPKDYGYRLLKKVLRNKLSIILFRLLHPDFASWIARFTSKTSRSYLAPPPEKRDYHLALFRNIADNHLKDDFDAVVYGHSHIPLVEQRGNGTLILLGDWISHNTFVLLENGEFTCHSWQPQEENENV